MKAQLFKNLAILFLMLSFLTSCQKQKLESDTCTSGCLIFEGNVQDNDGNPLEGILVELYQQIFKRGNGNDGLFGTDDRFEPELIGRTYTDENGHYNYLITGESYKSSTTSFAISILDEAYFFDYNINRKDFIDITSDDFDIPLVHDCTLYPKAYLALNLKNNISLDRIKLEIGKESFKPYIRNIDVDNYDLIDIVLDIDVVSGQFVNINYGYERDGEVFFGPPDSIYIEKGEQLEYLLEVDY